MKKYCFLLLLLICQLAAAQLPERILSFRSDIIVDTSGLVKVTETIKVVADGDKIKRGIFRTLPYFRKDRFGRKQRVDVKVTDVQRDGEQEPYHVADKNGSLIIYIGNANMFLESGTYTYRISYESRGHVGFFKEYDELYWNVTGNAWEFPIDTVEAVMHLPAGAPVKQMSCYTGVRGSAARDCNAKADAGGNAVFKAFGLGVFEGLTIAAGWQPGLIQRPPPLGFWPQIWYFKDFLLALAGVVFLYSFYYKRWRKYGRDAPDQVVVPSFKPPRDWSPAKIRYAYKRKIDSKLFSVTIIHMAVKKLLFVRQTRAKNAVFTLEKRAGDIQVLSEEERETYKRLFLQNTTLTVSNTNYRRFSDARSQLEKELKAELAIKDYYQSNSRQLWHASWCTVLVLLGFLFIVEEVSVSIGLTLGLVFWVGSVGAFVMGVKFFREKAFVSGLLLLFFSLPFLGATSWMLVMGISSFSLLSLVFSLMIITGFVLFIILIPAYTPEGSVLRAELKGFRLYLSTAEERRLNMLMPPELTPELFERLLPYAIALDLENKWAKKFEGVLKQTEYRPGWYAGEAFAYGALAGAMSKRLDTSLQRAQVGAVSSGSRSGSSSGSSGSSGSSSWSSGSGGGGSSGGGGGGGGGGGW
ncbi:DUF2207 domain-containing protein [Filimonas effusa]|uniref:DUF2207 domain-containing protein n=1 Tax=Filimonas effusa TaxID=2508721 RepID=A0A4Q1D3H6_9BACT|nr:DUF2207 domain-containing protein [Filimonas effusa]RXK82970.1 DUF2207 domain-containing protein [Filimonas effusa]